MRRLLKILLGVLVVLAVGVGALLWRLDQGPLSLTFMQPVLQYLIDRGTPYRISFTEPELVWLREEDAAGLGVRNLEVRTSKDELVAAAPLVQASVSVPPLLLEQRLELVDVTVVMPEIQLTRDEQRKLQLRFDQRLAAVPLGEAAGGGGVGTLLGDGGEVKDPRLASLRLVRVTAPSLQFVDATTGDRATATDAVFELEREGTIWQASLKSKLGDGTVTLIGEPTATPGRPDVTLEVEGLRPKDFVAFAPEVPLAGLDLPVSGKIHFSLDAAPASIGSATIDLTMGAGEIAVPTLGLAPIAIKQGALRGTVQRGWTAANVERLQLDTDGFSIGAAGTMTMVDDEIAASVTLDAKQLDVGEVLQLWPAAIAGGARDWIKDNVAAGQLSALSFQIDEHGARPGQPKLGGTFAFTGAQVRYLDTFPPAQGVNGNASLAGNNLQIKLKAARTGEVDLTQGTVTITSLIGDAVSQLQVKANLSSTIPAAMKLLDAEPVALGRSTGLRSDRAAGAQSSALELSLPLLDDIPPAKVRFKATSRLSKLELREVIPGYNIASESVSLVAQPAGITASGEIQLNGVPLTVNFTENTPPVKGVDRTVKVVGRLNAAGARALRVEWPEEIGGHVGVDATIVEGRKPIRTIDAALDLRDASVHLPDLVISKRPGQPGSATARLVQANQKILSVERVRVEVAGWLAEGEAALGLEPLRPERIALRQLRGPLGDVAADLRLDGARWRGRIDIGRLDLRPALQSSSGSAGGEAPELPDFLVQVSARQLRLGDAPFSNLAGTIERRSGIWQSAKLTANIEDSQVRLDLDTPTQRTAAILRGSDAGWLIRGLAASDNGIRGGTFRLSADLDQAGGGISGSGDLRIRNFTLWGAPSIARIISLASFSGLANAMSGRGVPVTRLIVPYRLQNDVMTIEQARMVGSDIGARADGTIDFGNDRLNITGTVAPAFTVNRIIGRIPIIGQILSGSRSEAALAATFSVSGPMGQPQVSVNPLSVLVPGMIRDLFSAFTADVEESGRTDER